MDDLISRQDAIRKICGAKCGCEPNECGLTMERDGAEHCTDIQLLMSLPSVQPERKTGNWTRISMDKYTRHALAWYRCSECQGEFIGKWNYCPNCGSHNGGEQNE